MKLVIFDMDGTMLDTERVSLEGTIHAGKLMGADISLEICQSFMGKNKATITEILYENFGRNFDPEKVFAIHDEYVDEYFEKHGVPVKNGIFELLDILEAAGIKKCVATSTSRERAIQKLESANLAHRFERIIGGDDIVNGKPAPDIFLKAAAECGVSPADCVVIEDTEAGILGAHAAGIRVIYVPDIAPVSDEVRAKAAAVCDDLLQVAGVVV